MHSANSSLSIGTTAYSNEVSTCFSYFSTLSSKEEVTNLCEAAFKADVARLRPEVKAIILKRWPSIIRNDLAGVPTQVPSGSRTTASTDDYYVSSFNITSFPPNVASITVRPTAESLVKKDLTMKEIMKLPKDARMQYCIQSASMYSSIRSVVEHKDKDGVVVMAKEIHNGYVVENLARDKTASLLSSVTGPKVENGKLEIVSHLPEQKKCDKAGIVIDVQAVSGLKTTVPSQFVPPISQSSIEYAHNISTGFQEKSKTEMTKTSIFVTNTVHRRNISRLQKLGTAGKYYASPREGYSVVPCRQIIYRQTLKDDQLKSERAIKEMNRRRGLLGENSAGPCGISVCGMYPAFFSKQQIDFYDRYLMLLDIIATVKVKNVLVLGLTGTEIQYLITNYQLKTPGLTVFGKIDRTFSDTVSMTSDYYGMQFGAIVDFSTGTVNYKEGESADFRMGKTNKYYNDRSAKFKSIFGKNVKVFQARSLPYFDFTVPFKGFYTSHNGMFMTGIGGLETSVDFLRRVITYNIYRSNYHLVQAPFYVVYPEIMEKVREPLLELTLYAPFIEQSTKNFLNYTAEDWDMEMAIPELDNLYKWEEEPPSSVETTTTTTSTRVPKKKRPKLEPEPQKGKQPEKKQPPPTENPIDSFGGYEFEEDIPVADYESSSES